MVRYAMVIDTFRCVRCHACTVACKAENYTPSGVYWHVILDREYRKYPNTTRRFLPKPCMHCENPPCVDACPTGASYKREDGIVLVDYEKCIGCKYCVAACPYDVRQYIEKVEGYFPEVGLTSLEEQGYQRHRVNTVEKCTFCADRIDGGVKKGLTPGVDWEATPACVFTCPAKARIFGDLDDPNSVVSKAARHAQPLLPELGTNPKVLYIGPLPPDVSVGLGKKVQVLQAGSLEAFKDVLKPVAVVAVGAVVVAAMANAVKSGREEKESGEGAK